MYFSRCSRIWPGCRDFLRNRRAPCEGTSHCGAAFWRCGWEPQRQFQPHFKAFCKPIYSCICLCLNFLGCHDGLKWENMAIAANEQVWED
jgi:hypothetical protein